MKEKLDWEQCKELRFAKQIQPDHNLINYLQESSNNKEKTTRLLPINETTKETIISLFYDVLRELLEALAIKYCYKIYNHECYTSFLKAIIKDENFALEFDSLRLLRNGINYYGRKINLNDAKLTIPKIEDLIGKVRNLLRKKEK